MALAESWHIRSRSRICAGSERSFEDGEGIVTALFPDPESSGYLRKDFSIAAWKARPAEETPPFSFWKAIFHAPLATERQDAFKRESPEDLLRRLVEEDEDHTENARYILAVMLERKKVLRETDTQRTPGGILRVYEHRKLGDVFIVKDPDIPLADVERVQEEVILLLEPGGRKAEEEPEPEPGPEPEGELAAAEPVAGEEGTAEAETAAQAGGEIPAPVAEEVEPEAPAETTGEAPPQPPQA